MAYGLTGKQSRPSPTTGTPRGKIDRGQDYAVQSSWYLHRHARSLLKDSRGITDPSWSVMLQKAGMVHSFNTVHDAPYDALP